MDTHFDFPHSDFQQINLDWMLDALKTANDNINTLSAKIAELEHINNFNVVASFVRDSASYDSFTIQLTKPCKEIYVFVRVPMSNAYAYSLYDIYSAETKLFSGAVRFPSNANNRGFAWGHAIALDRYPVLHYQTMAATSAIDSVASISGSLYTEMGYTELVNFAFTSLTFRLTSGNGQFPVGFSITIFGR